MALFGESDQDKIRREVATSILNGMIAVGDLRYIQDKSSNPTRELSLRAVLLADTLLNTLKEVKP